VGWRIAGARAVGSGFANTFGVDALGDFGCGSHALLNRRIGG